MKAGSVNNNSSAFLRKQIKHASHLPLIDVVSTFERFEVGIFLSTKVDVVVERLNLSRCCLFVVKKLEVQVFNNFVFQFESFV